MVQTLYIVDIPEIMVYKSDTFNVLKKSALLKGILQYDLRCLGPCFEKPCQ